MKHTPTVLCILDGWGHREETEHNAIAAAHTPNWDALLKTYPHGVLNASEGEVGLPDGQMGNSEVGHMNIGAGRIVMQDLPRINAAIADGSLTQNVELNAFITQLKQSGGACHLMGLLSDGGVHAHQDHMIALAQAVAAQGITVQVHAFLDGRDTPPKSALEYLAQMEKQIADMPSVKIATLCGRYYAMDRDNRWERVSKAYDMLTAAQGNVHATSAGAITASYSANITDEFVHPTIIGDYGGMQEGDGLFMANFRADRAREILTALLNPSFDGFERNKKVGFATALGMVEYSSKHNAWIETMFPTEKPRNTIGEVVASANLKQLRIAETEKYAHVTFFANGGHEEPFENEDRILVPSPDVTTYDLKPEMSASEVTDKLIEAIESDEYAFIFVNYANTDMVGHSGVFKAAVKAVETVDSCLGRLVRAVEKSGGAALVSADHGNAECMEDAKSGQPHTAHTLNLVPFVAVAPNFKNQNANIAEGRLADLAPTALSLMGITQPKEMTGTNLLADTKAHATSA